MQTRSLSMYCLLLVVFGHVLVLSGCRDATSFPGETPMHLHVVCVLRVDPQTATCKSPERVTLFNIWVQEAISRPQSMFGGGLG
jgi:hypothetical protein